VSRLQFNERSILRGDTVLIYIHIDEINQIIKELLHVGNIIVLNEWHAFNKWRAFLLNTLYHFKSVLTARQQFKTIQFSPMSKASLGLFVGALDEGL